MTVSRRSAKPSKQGELDGACGFYAIVNAIHSLEPDFDKNELMDWTMQGYLSDGDPMKFFRGTLRGSVKNTLRRLIDHLNEHPEFDLVDDKTDSLYQFDFSMPFWRSDELRTRDTVLEQLARADHKSGTVCIMAYDFDDGSGRTYAHWTVIKGFKDNHLVTHDSGGEMARIGLEQVRVDAEFNQHKSRPFNIRGKDIFVIYRLPA